MLKDLSPGNILFLDIETVPHVASYNQCEEPLRLLWDKKAAYISSDPAETAETLWPRAGIYAEFGKIICISTAYLAQDVLRVKNFYGHNEHELLSAFTLLLNGFFNKDHHLLCAHNGKEFDFPYIARRLLINRITLPAILDVAGSKPWQIRHLDTMELWKFGDYKHYTSLELLAAIFNIPSPKNDINGADVARVYWCEHDLERIAAYCNRDVVTMVQVLMAYMGRPVIADENMLFL